MDCGECRRKYGFFSRSHGERDRLVLLSDLKAIKRASEAWHEKIKEIESSAEFKIIKEKLNARLILERYATDRHRLLRNAELNYGQSISQYRRYGYTLTASDIGAALKLLGLQFPGLEAKVEEAEKLWQQSKMVPAGIRTGITGLEM